MTILVTGATGNIGRLVVNHLLAGGAKVRALTTNPKKAALPAEVEVAQGYIGRPETLPAALEGIEKMYLAPLPETVKEVVRLAKDAGVRHIVDLSGEPDNWWYGVAEAVEVSGVAWTHLWPGEFMDNMLMWADQIRFTGEVRDAYPNAANAQIDLDDIAAVAAAALLDEQHIGKAYTLTGPETLTRAEMVGLIGQALGRHIPCIKVTREQAIEQLAPTMGEFADWYVDNTAEMVEHPQIAVPTVAEILRRPATTFAQWAVKNVEKFR